MTADPQVFLRKGGVAEPTDLRNSSALAAPSPQAVSAEPPNEAELVQQASKAVATALAAITTKEAAISPAETAVKVEAAIVATLRAREVGKEFRVDDMRGWNEVDRARLERAKSAPSSVVTAALEKAEQRLRDANAALRDAKADLDRANAALRDANAALDRANADLDRAKAALREAENAPLPANECLKAFDRAALCENRGRLAFVLGKRFDDQLAISDMRSAVAANALLLGEGVDKSRFPLMATAGVGGMGKTELLRSIWEENDSAALLARKAVGGRRKTPDFVEWVNTAVNARRTTHCVVRVATFNQVPSDPQGTAGARGAATS